MIDPTKLASLLLRRPQRTEISLTSIRTGPLASQRLDDSEDTEELVVQGTNVDWDLLSS